MEKPKESADHRIKKHCIGPGFLRMMWSSSEETFRERPTSTLVSPVLVHSLLHSDLEWQRRTENIQLAKQIILGLVSIAINCFASYV